MQCFATSIRHYNPGRDGYIASLSTTASPPESLRRIAHWLSKHGFTVRIERAVPVSLLRLPVEASTITGWLLTWWRETSRGLVSCGSQWVDVGAVDSEIPSTLIPADE